MMVHWYFYAVKLKPMFLRNHLKCRIVINEKAFNTAMCLYCTGLPPKHSKGTNSKAYKFRVSRSICLNIIKLFWAKIKKHLIIYLWSLFPLMALTLTQHYKKYPIVLFQTFFLTLNSFTSIQNLIGKIIKHPDIYMLTGWFCGLESRKVCMRKST